VALLVLGVTALSGVAPATEALVAGTTAAVLVTEWLVADAGVPAGVLVTPVLAAALVAVLPTEVVPVLEAVLPTLAASLPVLELAALEVPVVGLVGKWLLYASWPM
jgi:hypothetical protein